MVRWPHGTRTRQAGGHAAPSERGRAHRDRRPGAGRRGRARHRTQAGAKPLDHQPRASAKRPPA
nr:hypothetical protein [Bifidobacterium pseudocatenulatum]